MLLQLNAFDRAGPVKNDAERTLAAIAGSSCFSEPAAALRGLAKAGRPGFASLRIQFRETVLVHEDFAAHFQNPRRASLQLASAPSEWSGYFG